VSRSSASLRKLSVCLLASHPLVLSEFNRLLSDAPFHIQPKKLQPILTDSKSVSVPRAGVYLIDYTGNTAATTGLVSSIMCQYANARVLLVGDSFDDRTAFPFLHMGVKGLLEHTLLGSQLESALQSVASGGYWVPRALLSRFVDFVLKKEHPHMPPPSTTTLSRREKEVADALLENLSNKEIANKLNISERTVKFHVSNLLAKFGVGRRADLIVLRYQEASRAMTSISPSGAGTRVN
jgi:DNA-binding NarL/FixJ family response regulator